MGTIQMLYFCRETILRSHFYDTAIINMCAHFDKILYSPKVAAKFAKSVDKLLFVARSKHFIFVDDYVISYYELDMQCLYRT